MGTVWSTAVPISLLLLGRWCNSFLILLTLFVMYFAFVFNTLPIILLIAVADGVANILRAAQTRIRDSTPGRGKKDFFSLKGPYLLWGLSSLLLNGYWKQISRGLKLATYVFLVPRLRTRGAIHPLSYLPSLYAQRHQYSYRYHRLWVIDRHPSYWWHNKYTVLSNATPCAQLQRFADSRCLPLHDLRINHSRNAGWYLKMGGEELGGSKRKGTTRFWWK